MTPILALYVYSPTTFKTNRTIESEQGQKYHPGDVNLGPGIYRLEADAKIAALDAKATNGTAPHDLVIVNGTKNHPTDPPARALQTFGIDRIKAFLSGEGDDDMFG
jgi:hypothetical protein